MGQRLLLVDSDRSFLKEHQVSLEAAYDLDVAPSPDSVVSRLEGGAFAAVFICVEVADNKGYALCSTIRKNPKLEGVKIVLISAKATEEEYRRHQSLKGRADLYLHKPISTSALVAALAPFVPGRALDPDKPLGELVDTELGDDWLDGLKSALDGPAGVDSAPVFGVRAPIAAARPSMDPKATAPPDTSRLQLLEEQVSALHQELRAKELSLTAADRRIQEAEKKGTDAEQRLTEQDQRLATAEQRLQMAEVEAQQAQRQLNSVTLNLDELERSTRESEALKARLAETEAALRGLEESRGRDGESAETLKAQLREALTERTDLIQQVETLNAQVGDKAQRAIELLKERDRLLHETLDLEPFRAKAQELEASLAAREEALAAKDQVLLAKDDSLRAKQAELETALVAQNQLHATVEGLVAQQAVQEGLLQATLLELTGTKEKAHAFQLEIGGLEATMRSQGRDLGELGASLKELESHQQATKAQLLEREQDLEARQVFLEQQRQEIARLQGEMAQLRQEMDEAKIQHEGERLELMNGLDQKEAELLRLNEVITTLQQAQGAMTREREALQGQLSGHRDRLQALDGMFQVIQEQLRRASELTRD